MTLSEAERIQLEALQRKQAESAAAASAGTSGKSGSESSSAGTSAAPGKTDDKNLEEFINQSDIKLSESEKEFIKKNPNLKDILIHQIEQKRMANKEAQKYRTDLEKANKEKSDREIEEAKKRGEFEKLYNDQANKTKELEEKYKQKMLNSEINIEAIRLGIQKPEFTKLLDHSKIKFDTEGNPINLKEVIEEFKKDYPALFSSASGSTVPDSRRPGGPEGQASLSLEELRLQADKTRDRKDIARYFAALKEQKT